jgi:hypothetical protein
LGAACNSILGVDGDYVVGDPFGTSGSVTGVGGSGQGGSGQGGSGQGGSGQGGTSVADGGGGAGGGQVVLVDDQLLLHLDAARARNGLTPHPAGCGADALIWTDLSSTGADGILTNFSSCDPSSGWNGAGTAADPHRLVFRGSDDNLVDLGSDLFNGADQGTVEAWYRMDTPPTLTGDANTSGYGLLSSASTSDDGKFFAVNVFVETAADPRLNAWCRNPFDVVHGESNLPSATWLHLAVTSDGATTRMYVNAVEESATAIRGTDSGRWFADAVAGEMLYTIGRVRRASHSNTFIPDDSALSILRLHGRQLSRDELLANCQAQVARFAGASCGP